LILKSRRETKELKSGGEPTSFGGDTLLKTIDQNQKSGGRKPGVDPDPSLENRLVGASGGWAGIIPQRTRPRGHEPGRRVKGGSRYRQ